MSAKFNICHTYIYCLIKYFQRLLESVLFRLVLLIWGKKIYQNFYQTIQIYQPFVNPKSKKTRCYKKNVTRSDVIKKTFPSIIFNNYKYLLAGNPDVQTTVTYADVWERWSVAEPGSQACYWTPPASSPSTLESVFEDNFWPWKVPSDIPIFLSDGKYPQNSPTTFCLSIVN